MSSFSLAHCLLNLEVGAGAVCSIHPLLVLAANHSKHYGHKVSAYTNIKNETHIDIYLNTYYYTHTYYVYIHINTYKYTHTDVPTMNVIHTNT